MAGTDDPTDVVIIGAGASGGVAALRLARAGCRVVCLEQGDWPDRTAFGRMQEEWELVSGKEWSSLPRVRQARADYPIDCSKSDLEVVNFNGVGGGTVLFAAIWPRLLPTDFRTHSSAGVGDDWPISYAELQPFYERTDREIGVSGLGGNPRYPAGEDPPLPPLPIGEAGTRLARAHARLGWHWWPDSNAILSAPFDGRHVCVQRGTCQSGCAEGAKASTDLTHWPKALALGARLITGARVRRVLIDGRGRASGVEWCDAQGREHVQWADVVLCAANGVGTSRLLLASAAPAFPDGLANGSGLLGRRLMLHPAAHVVGYFEDIADGWQGHSGSAIQSLEFYGTDESRGFVGGSKWSFSPAGGPLGTAMGLVAMGEGSAPLLGEGHHRHFRERFGHGFRWTLLCEDQPSEANRVELSKTECDASGLAAPQVLYRVDENVRRLMQWNIERATESFYEAGARMTEVKFVPVQGHLLGTARMGDDATTSVVDRWCMAHEIPNLGVIDGSVFVTAGAVNPTSTICALALRAVEHLLEHRSDVVVATHARSYAVAKRDADDSGTSNLDLGENVKRGSRDGTDHAPLTIRTGPFADSVALTDGERRRFETIADEILPPDDEMPAPSDVDIGGAPIDWVLRARPDLVEPLRRVLAQAPIILGPSWTSELRATDPNGWHALLVVVFAAYYHVGDVCRLLEYPGRVAVPVPAASFPSYVAEGLLDHLLERG